MQHPYAWADYSRRDCRIYYWRTKSGTEVDFVICGRDTFAAIEVKNSRQMHSKDLKGLKAFAEDYPEAQYLLVVPWKGNPENRGHHVHLLAEFI